jgi:hypothetical protein
MKSKNNFFTDNESIRTLDTLRMLYFIIFLISFGLTEIGRFVYRPYIYSNGINDYGIADSIGNLGGIVVQIFFMITVFNSPGKKALHVIIFLVLGYTLYEIIQPYLPKGVFDWKDIYGTWIGGLIAFLLLRVLHKIVTNNKVFFKF